MVANKEAYNKVLLKNAGIACTAGVGVPEKYLRAIIPTVPMIMVTRNWLMLPRIVSVIALSLFCGCTYTILPPYSPIRLGVSIVMLQPASTDLKAFAKENFSRGFICICHLRASIPQFTATSTTASQKNGFSQLSFISSQRSSRLG